MRITIHITFFYLPHRVVYMNNIIDETNKYGCRADIHVHTNNHTLTKRAFHLYTNGRLRIIHHDLTNMDPFLLPWLCRGLMAQQRHKYDAFMYIEDDMLVPYKAIQYWLHHNEKLIRINNKEYITDLPNVQLDTYIQLDKLYCVNNKNPYCAFWIYNKAEFNKFVNSKYYDIKNIDKYETREKAAIGLHGKYTPWYKATLIPVHNNKLIDDCKIYHMPNNYIPHPTFATIQFDDALKFLARSRMMLSFLPR